MTTLERPPRRREPRPTRRRRTLLVLAGIALAAVAFLLGIGFARALDERPRSGDPVTTVRTLSPRPQDVPPRTVTVTVTR